MDFSISGIILILALALSIALLLRDMSRQKRTGRLVSREAKVIYCLTAVALVYWVVRYIMRL